MEHYTHPPTHTHTHTHTPSASSSHTKRVLSCRRAGIPMLCIPNMLNTHTHTLCKNKQTVKHMQKTNVHNCADCTPPVRSLRSLAKSQRAPAEMRDNGTAALQPLIAERIIFFTITTGWGRGGSVCSCMSIILRKQNSQGRQQRQREGEGTE